MDEYTERRLAANELLFRDVNEAILRGQWPGEETAPSAFRCECAQPDCNALLELTRTEYEQIRSHPRWFLVLPGHERAQIETVVSERGGYLVVEKRAEAGAMADATDPRA
jgi:hypothetical protein